MKRALTTIVTTVVTACLACMAAGCSNLPSVEEAAQSQAKASHLSAGATLSQGALVVGVNIDDAPYAWRSAVTSAAPIDGVDVDVALALAENMGLTARFVNIGTDYSAAANGVCDVVMGGTAATVNDGTEIVVGAYSESSPAVFSKDPSGVPTIDALAVSSIGVQENSASARALQAMVPTAPLVGFATLNDAFAALEAGNVTFVACDSFMGGYLATAYPDIALAGALSMPETRGVAVSAGNIELQDAVRNALDVMAADGELRQIRSRWVGDLAAITASNQIVTVQG